MLAKHGYLQRDISGVGVTEQYNCLASLLLPDQVSNWLQEFAYRIPLTFFPFIMGMLAALCIAFFTLTYFGFKAARQNIVQALKYE